MKSSLWILNSAFLLFITLLIGYVFLFREKIPTPMPIEPQIEIEALKREIPKVNIKRVYEDNDLFNTFQQPVVESVVEEKKEIPKLPQPPQEREVTEEAPLAVQFLEPLNIELKGIIYTENESENKAIIADKQTKEEKLYGVGDKVFDAYILRIFKNSIIILRSNGQQEVIYVSKAEAQKALEQMQKDSWNNVVQKENDNKYILDQEALNSRINNLAQFIDMLDLTTVFRKGESIGIRVGKIEEQSLGNALGLATGDIIISINNIPPISTKNRLSIYNNLKNLKYGDSIIIDFVRNKNLKTIEYVLQKLSTEKTEITIPGSEKIPVEVINPKNIESLESKYAFDSLEKNIKRYDKQAMLKYGSKDSIINNLS